MTDSTDDFVYLTSSPLFHGDQQYNDYELVARSELPGHAVRGAGDLQSDGTDGGVAGHWYEEWVVI